MVRALHYITGRLQVLIQTVCFCPSGECARTLFKSSESKPTISNKKNNSHRASQPENFTPRGPTPLASSVFERIILQKVHITFYICLQSQVGVGAKWDFRTDSPQASAWAGPCQGRRGWRAIISKILWYQGCWYRSLHDIGTSDIGYIQMWYPSRKSRYHIRYWLRYRRYSTPISEVIPPISQHLHQQTGVKLLGLIFFSPYYWQLLAIICNYWLLLVLFFCEKYYYYWLLLDYTHIINYWD